jgi:hypothetical protein
MQLYLTDYRSLFVPRVGEITADPVREEDADSEHLLRYYAQRLPLSGQPRRR